MRRDSGERRRIFCCRAVAYSRVPRLESIQTKNKVDCQKCEQLTVAVAIAHDSALQVFV